MPQKRKQPKNKSWVQLASNFVAQWPEVLEGIELTNMPIHYLRNLSIVLKNHITINVDVEASLKKLSRRQTANMVKTYIHKHYANIKNVELSFNVAKLKADMQGKTKQILNKTFK
tara:strand:+ start:1029 stop:1373 length:345 start_codon:yes stop_codon:yes gene_type:complete